MYCLVTGGNMINKGAQSMTFIIINELKKRYPEDTILLMLPDEVSTIDWEKYTVKPVTAHIKSIFYLMGGVARCMAIIKKVDHSDTDKLNKIMGNARMLVDISGYALGSNWGDYLVRFYLCMIHLAHKFNVPTYIMPQSFGPFAYKAPKSFVANWYINKVMHYPKVIYAREQEGYDSLMQKFHLTNVVRSYDMVLMSTSVDPKNIFTSQFARETITINNNSVAIIPNVRLLEKVEKERLFNLYLVAATAIISTGMKIYIFFHSGEDQDLAREIFSFLSKKGISVSFFDVDLNCLEFGEVISQFNFIIASRYHSLVHAYKEGVPCIALGWAVKYRELLREIGQEDFAFDISDTVNNDFVSALEKMISSLPDQKRIINNNLCRMQSANIFDCLDGNN